MQKPTPIFETVAAGLYNTEGLLQETLAALWPFLVNGNEAAVAEYLGRRPDPIRSRVESWLHKNARMDHVRGVAHEVRGQMGFYPRKSHNSDRQFNSLDICAGSGDWYRLLREYFDPAEVGRIVLNESNIPAADELERLVHNLGQPWSDKVEITRHDWLSEDFESLVRSLCRDGNIPLCVNAIGNDMGFLDRTGRSSLGALFGNVLRPCDRTIIDTRNYRQNLASLLDRLINGEKVIRQGIRSRIREALSSRIGRLRAVINPLYPNASVKVEYLHILDAQDNVIKDSETLERIRAQLEGAGSVSALSEELFVLFSYSIDLRPFGREVMEAIWGRFPLLDGKEVLTGALRMELLGVSEVRDPLDDHLEFVGCMDDMGGELKSVHGQGAQVVTFFHKGKEKS